MRMPMSDDTSSVLNQPPECESDSVHQTERTERTSAKTDDESEYEKNKPVLTILYQDEHLVAIDKPAGLFVHRSFMDKDEIYFALQLIRDQIGQYVYPVHRLDKPTSGVLLFALTQDVARKMGELFSNSADLCQSAEQGITNNEKCLSEITPKNKKIQKTYYALTRGHLQGKALIDYALTVKLDKIGDKGARSDKPPQEAQTYYESMHRATLPIALGKYDSVRYTLVKVLPMTGRKHQIRRHLAHLRHPIIGDINYGDNKQNPFFIKHFGFKRLMLIAKEISFNHPVTGKLIEISAEFDEQWLHVFSELNWEL
jgi:tRNA pseudouridine65 synthase